MLLRNQTTHLSLLLLTTCSLTLAQAFDPTKPTKDYIRMSAQVVATENGVASAPIALLSDSMVTFAKRSVGTASASQTVQLTNGGTLPVAITSVSLGGANPGDFILPMVAAVAWRWGRIAASALYSSRRRRGAGRRRC